MLNKSDFPLISIIITSYNRAHYIGEAITSALAQDYPNFEVVISDNASTDNTDEIIAKYKADPRVKYYKNDNNIGMLPNFKKATEELAKGEYITYISSDDYFINDSLLTEATTLFNEGENIVLVLAQNKTYNEYTDSFTLSMPGNLFSQKYKKGTDVFLDIPKTGSYGLGAVLYDKKVFMSTNPFNYKIFSLDFLVNNFLLLRGDVGFIDKPSYIWRFHGNQESQKYNTADMIANFDYFLKPFQYAKQHKIVSDAKLEKWKNDILFHEARYLSLRFLPVNKSEFNIFLEYFKINHFAVYKRLKANFKWNRLVFLFNRPDFSLKLFKIFSKRHYRYLNEILAGGKYLKSSK